MTQEFQPYEAMSKALSEMAEPEFPIALDDNAKARVRAISEEQGVDVYDVVRTFAEEGALNYFRGRSDDPSKT